MVVTNWLLLLRNRLAFQRWHRRQTFRRRKQPVSLPVAAEALETRTLLAGAVVTGANVNGAGNPNRSGIRELTFTFGAGR